ncbi:MAG: NTP transferase domain-containing protein [Myxococcota bacterium]
MKLSGLVLAAGKGSRMKSDLPKVLHPVNGRPMVWRAIDALRSGGVEDVCCVVGYRADAIQAELGDSFRYVMQTEQRGTGHAVMVAKDALTEMGGAVIVAYGDAPMMSPESVRRLGASVLERGADASLLTIELNSPPAAGRIIRDGDDQFVRVIEEQDCTPNQKKIREINVGMYCFRVDTLLPALDQLDCDNAQGEYYLTDVPEILRSMGGTVEVVKTDDILETLGVNDRHHLQFAESVEHIKHAESLYPLVDAAVAMTRGSNL